MDLAKYHMSDSHINVRKKHLNCFLLYSDVDSLLYEIKHVNFFEELAPNKNLHQYFDLSNYPTDHLMYNDENTSATLNIKDELAGEPREHLLGKNQKSVLHLGRWSTEAICQKRQSIRSEKPQSRHSQKNFETCGVLQDHQHEDRFLYTSITNHLVE